MKNNTNSAAKLAGTVLTLVLVCALFTLAGCAQIAGKQASLTADTAGAADGAALENRDQRLSYALGMVLGNQFRAQSVEIDQDLYSQGLKDALAGGNTLLTESEARSAVNMLQRELKRKQMAPRSVSTAPTGIEISFKLDTRLTRGMYMGDRWVSPPTFSQVGTGNAVTVVARTQGMDATGRKVNVIPEWIPDDPGMVTVNSGPGNEVRITVRREGQSRLKVVAPGVSEQLDVKAAVMGDSLQVEISRCSECGD